MDTQGIDFVDRLDALLKSKNLKREAVMSYAGITYNSMTLWRKRNTVPSGSVLIKIAEFLNVSVEYLVTGVDPTGLKPEVLEVANTLQHFNEQDFEVVKQMVKTMDKRYNKDGTE